MPTELTVRRERVRKERDDLEHDLAKKIAEIDKLEEDEAKLRKRRKELKDRDPETEEILLKVQEQLKQNHEDIAKIVKQVKAANDRVDAMRSNLDKFNRRIKKLTRRIRNQLKPKVVNLNLQPARAMSPMGTIQASVGHYTAGALATTDEQAIRLWRLVDQQHKNLGWAMCGYHIGLGPEGGVYLLRPMWAAGSHTLGFNTGYVGFNVHGTTGHTWTSAQLRAFRYALKKYNLDGKRVYGHNDLGSTACPGSFKAKYVSKGQ